MAAVTGSGQAAPGWYDDPMGRHQHRYWDGAIWTGDVADAGVASVDPIAGPAAVTPAATQPVMATPESAPAPKKGRVGLVVGVSVGVIALLAVVGGGALYLSSVGSARAAAQTAIVKAETALADAELCAEEGNDAAASVEAARKGLAEAKAKQAAGSSFSAAPYREAATLAASAASSANGVLSRLDSNLEKAGTLGDSGTYDEAVQAWSELAKAYPRSDPAAKARQAALDMLTDVADDSGVTLEEDLRLSADVAAMFPAEELPDELTGHVTKALLDGATTDLESLQQVATANATWARDLARKGRISGSVVLAFQNQAYDSEDVAEVQRIQGMLGTLGQPEQMGRLYAGLANAMNLAAGCRSVADHPKRQTSTSRTFSSGQIASVKSKAAAMQRAIDECRAIANGLSTSI